MNWVNTAIYSIGFLMGAAVTYCILMFVRSVEAFDGEEEGASEGARSATRASKPEVLPPVASTPIGREADE